MACVLLDSGADPHDKSDSEMSPLADAIDAGAVGLVRALLERNVSVTEGDDSKVKRVLWQLDFYT